MNIMLDLETMGNGSNAAIVAIGAVAFNIHKRELGSEFYRTVTLASSMSSGGVCDASTIMWWLSQSEESRLSLTSLEPVPIEVALAQFACWYSQVAEEDGEVWGNGATADNVWMANAYRRLGLRVPWSYKKDRCYRTVRALHPKVERKPFGVAHNALDDAKSQALHLIEMLNPQSNEAHT